MKKIFLNSIILFMAVGLFAQDNPSAQSATDELVKIYELDADQTQQMLVIQKRKVRNLDQIVDMKTDDVKMYRHKVRAIHQSTDASIRRMLTKEQMEIYQKKRLEWRENRAKKIEELKGNGMSLEEIENVLIDEGY